MFSTWLKEKDINAICASLKKQQIDSRLMVSTVTCVHLSGCHVMSLLEASLYTAHIVAAMSTKLANFHIKIVEISGPIGFACSIHMGDYFMQFERIISRYVLYKPPPINYCCHCPPPNIHLQCLACRPWLSLLVVCVLIKWMINNN